MLIHSHLVTVGCQLVPVLKMDLKTAALIRRRKCFSTYSATCKTKIQTTKQMGAFTLLIKIQHLMGSQITDTFTFRTNAKNKTSFAMFTFISMGVWCQIKWSLIVLRILRPWLKISMWGCMDYWSMLQATISSCSSPKTMKKDCGEARSIVGSPWGQRPRKTLRSNQSSSLYLIFLVVICSIKELKETVKPTAVILMTVISTAVIPTVVKQTMNLTVEKTAIKTMTKTLKKTMIQTKLKWTGKESSKLLLLPLQFVF